MFFLDTEVSTPKMTVVLLLDMDEVFAKVIFARLVLCGVSDHADAEGTQLLVSYCR